MGATFSRIVKKAESFEIPFTHTLPLRLQIRRLPKRSPAFRELGDTTRPHFPKYMPALPDSHTYNGTAGEIIVSSGGDQVDTVTGYKHLESALEGLKKVTRLCRKKRVAEYEVSLRMDDVLSSQHGMWQRASIGLHGVSNFTSSDLSPPVRVTQSEFPSLNEHFTRKQTRNSTIEMRRPVLT